jgi:hypothetical protein
VQSGPDVFADALVPQAGTRCPTLRFPNPPYSNPLKYPDARDPRATGATRLIVTLCETRCRFAAAFAARFYDCGRGLRKRALIAAMKSSTAAGGSMTMPRVMIQKLAPIAVASIKYWEGIAKAVLAA